MLVRRICAALTTTALAFGGLVLAATPSNAESNSCSSPTPMAGTAASTIGPSDRYDYWSYETFVGTYTVTMTASSSLPGINVMGEGCAGQLCDGSGSSATETCSFTVATPQTIVVRVFNVGSVDEPYTLTVTWDTGEGLPGVPPLGDAGDCNLIDDAGICLALTSTGPIPSGDLLATVRNPITVYGPGLEPGPGVTIVGSIDLYAFDLPVGGTANIPCVTLMDVDPCAALGGERLEDGNIFTLGETPVSVPDVTVDTPLLTIQLCKARLTATVVGIGVSNVPAYTIC